MLMLCYLAQRVCKLLLQIVSSMLVRVERRKLLLTSGYQFVFYLLLLVAGIVPFHSFIYRATTQVSHFYRVTLHTPVMFSAISSCHPIHCSS